MADEGVAGTEVGLWTVAFSLSKHEPGRLISSMTLHWRRDMTREEAIGSALEEAMKAKPGFSVDAVLADMIEPAPTPPPPPASPP